MDRPSESRIIQQHRRSKREQAKDTVQTQTISQTGWQDNDSIIAQRSRRSRRPLSFLHTVLIVLLCPYIIASIQDALLFSSGSEDIWAIQSSRSAAFFGGVRAMAVPKSQPAKRHQSVFDIERQQRTTERPANATWYNGTAAGVHDKHSEQSQQPIKVVDVPSKRWGHSVAYLREANVALFIGGQVSSDYDSMVLTNDVFAMDLSVNSTQTWVQLSSDNLAPHAFAARAVTHDEEGSDERIFIVGGATNDCSSNASQISMWKAGESWQDGQWSTPAFNEGAAIPQRRRGARAIQVPVQISLPKEASQQAILAGGVSFMVIGGSSDESTCSNVSSLSSNVGVWTMGAGAGEGRRARNSSAASTFDTRPLVLSSELTNISVADYSAIYLPANETQGDRVLLLGGLDKDGNLTSFENPWVLDLASGLWSQMPTTNSTSSGNDIPHGRMGHTSTRTENGTIIVYGGYTSLANDRVPTSDVHVLNYTVSPAVWSRVNSSQAPERAFHTAFMAGQVMVVGFGEGDYNSSSNSTKSSNATSNLQSRSVSNSSQAIEFLDTINWAWANSMAAVLAAREPSPPSTNVASSTTVSPTSSAMATSSASSKSSIAALPISTATKAPETTVSQPSTTTQEESTPTTSAMTAAASSAITTAAASSEDVPSTTDSDSNSSVSGGRVSQSHGWPSSSIAQPSSTSTSDSSGSGGSMTPQQRNTAVIASVLGAAAVAASMAGLYAAYKRREARMNGDHYSMSGDKYEHFSSSAPGPPVSALWYHQLKRKATLASDAVINRGRSFKRGGQSPHSGAASAGTSPRSFMGNYSMPTNEGTFRVLGSMPATSLLSMRRNEMMQQEATRDQLYMQEAMQSDLPDSFLHTILNDDDNDYGRKLIVPPLVAYNTRALSSESLESDGAMSHFSYPYLSAMHRHGPAGSPSTNGSPNGSSPRYSPQQFDNKRGSVGYSNFAMTPNWSPSSDAVEIMPEMRRSVASMQIEHDPFQDNVTSPPFFPPEAPMAPQQAYHEPNMEQRKIQHSALRVMNDAGY